MRGEINSSSFFCTGSILFGKEKVEKTYWQCWKSKMNPKPKNCLSSHENIWFLCRPLFHHDNILFTIHFQEHNRSFEANSTVSGICFCFGSVWKRISSSSYNPGRVERKDWLHERPFISKIFISRFKSRHLKHAVVLRLHCHWQSRSSPESSETFHPITDLHIHVLDLKTSRVSLIFQSRWISATSCYPKVMYVQSCLYTFVWCGDFGDMKCPVHPWLNSLAVWCFHLTCLLLSQWLVDLYPFSSGRETICFNQVITKIKLIMNRAIIWISDGLHKKLWLRSVVCRIFTWSREGLHHKDPQTYTYPFQIKGFVHYIHTYCIFVCIFFLRVCLSKCVFRSV